MMNQLTDTLNEVSLVYTRPRTGDVPQIGTSQQVSDLFRSCYAEGTIDFKEFFYVMYLNNSNMVLAVSKVSEGGITSAVVDPRLVFQQALLLHATNIIVCHNHPSGTLSPSEGDVLFTQKLTEAGMLLWIRVLDHIILTSEGYYSFADNGILN